MLHSPLSNSKSSDTNDLVILLERIVQCRTGSRIHDLHIDVLDEQVIISGRADSYYAKQLATHAAIEQIANRQLTNAIDVC